MHIQIHICYFSVVFLQRMSGNKGEQTGKGKQASKSKNAKPKFCLPVLHSALERECDLGKSTFFI